MEEIKEELIEAENSQFREECNKLINRISEMFESNGFTEMYKNINKGKCTFDELDDYIYETLIKLSDDEQYDLNVAWSMLSTTNCWWLDYEVGQRIHRVLIDRIWYPEV